MNNMNLYDIEVRLIWTDIGFSKLLHHLSGIWQKVILITSNHTKLLPCSFHFRLMDALGSETDMTSEVEYLVSDTPTLSLWCRVQRSAAKVLYTVFLLLTGLIYYSSVGITYYICKFKKHYSLWISLICFRILVLIYDEDNNKNVLCYLCGKSIWMLSEFFS